MKPVKSKRCGRCPTMNCEGCPVAANIEEAAIKSAQNHGAPEVLWIIDAETDISVKVEMKNPSEEAKALLHKMFNDPNYPRKIRKPTRWIFDLDAWKNNTTPDAKEWVEEQFPKKHYGDDIYTYEAWDMRALLEQAYMAGKESNDR